MFRKSLTAAFVLLAAGAGLAAEVAPGDVIAAVETFVRQVSADPRPEARVAELQPHRIEGRIVAYIAHLAGGGFCIAGADDRLVPVAADVPQGSYDPNCPGNKWMLDDLATRLTRFENAEAANDPILGHYRDRLAQRRRDWLSLSARQPPVLESAAGARDAPSQMALPLTSRWHQQEPFNRDLPFLPRCSWHDTTRTLVGPVAVASTQIMYYWKWPSNLWFSWRWTQYPVYEVTFPNLYDETRLNDDPGPIPMTLEGRLGWEWNTWYERGILEIYGYWDDSLRQEARSFNQDPAYLAALEFLFSRQESLVWQFNASHSGQVRWDLMHDVANDPPGLAESLMAEFTDCVVVAVESDVGVLWTESDHGRAVTALVGDFQYHQNAHNATMNLSETILEIQWLRPVQMSGAGHSWVVYGYNTGVAPYQFLMNYGMGGAPVWATVDDMFPGDHEAIRHIAPNDVVRFVGSTVHGDGSPSIPYRDLAVAGAHAPTGCTLIFRAGTDNPFAASSITIDRAMTLKGVDVRIRPQ